MFSRRSAALKKHIITILNFDCNETCVIFVCMKKMVLFLLAVFALACGNSRAVDNCTAEYPDTPLIRQYDKEMFPNPNVVDNQDSLMMILDRDKAYPSNIDVQDQLRFFREIALPLILNDTATIECSTFRPTLEAYKEIIFLSDHQTDSLRIPIKDLNIPGYDMKCDDNFSLDVLPLPKRLVAIRLRFDKRSMYWGRGAEIFIVLEYNDRNGKYKITSRGCIIET